jgi:hypothetical protein
MTETLDGAANGGSDSRWSTVGTVLFDPTTGIVPPLQSDVRFGLTMYSSDGGYGSSDTKTCPVLVTVPIALNNYAAMNASYQATKPYHDTPTAESVAAAASELQAMTDTGPKIVILATDGEPDSCVDANPKTDAGLQAARDGVVAAVTTAFGGGIQTYVVFIGTDSVSADHLQNVANAGVGNPVGGAVNAPYYTATNQADLVAAFNTIIAGVRSCVVTLDGTVSAQSYAAGTVTLNGTALVYNDPNGYRLDSPSELELLGSSCDAIKSGNPTLSIVYPCGTFVIINQ